MLKLDNVMTAGGVKALLKRLLPCVPSVGTALPPSSFYRPDADCQVRGLDAIYNAAFGNLKHGVFVEVGAYDGQFVSNTCFLADLGWTYRLKLTKVLSGTFPKRQYASSA